ncbi:MAG: sugar phosphate nucleotidyltransferase [Candidatus Sumerlaeia bacterium]
MSSFKRIAVIMAGGTGERFWPLSRAARPKQLLKLTRPDLSLLEEAIERIAPLVGYENILIATSATVAEPIKKALAGSRISAGNVIVEPAKRNTAGALAWVAANALARWGAEGVSMAVLTADHAIGEPELFRKTVDAALDAAEREGALVTLGINPTRAETGYGYIEIKDADREIGVPGISISRVAAFREKPDRASAEQFVAAGRFFWNSGMFFWRLDSFLDELTAASPAHGAAAAAMAEALRAGDAPRAAAIFNALNDISIDYALMEKARHVLMARADFPWDDVGAWDALARSFPADAAKNVTIGDPILIDTRNSIVYNEPGAEKMAVAAVGVDNLIVVVSADGVVVIPRDRAQDVKKIVAELKLRKAGQL